MFYLYFHGVDRYSPSALLLLEVQTTDILMGKTHTK